MGNGWFETVAEAERRAKRQLPRSVYMAITAGLEFGLTAKDNVSAFGELGFAPHVAGLSAARDLTTTVMDQPVALPVIISPTGVQAVHPEGEVAVARAAASRGTAIGLSSFASQADRGRRRGKPTDLLSDLLVRFSRADDAAPRACSGSRLGRPDPHSRLVLLTWPGLGQPSDTRPDRPAHDGPLCPRGAPPAPLVSALGRHRESAGHERALHGPSRRAGTDVLRRLRGVDAVGPALVGGHRVAARALEGSLHAEGRHAGRRCTEGRRRRRDRDLGVESRGNNLDGTPAAIRALPRDRRGRRRPGRGTARQRSPSRK